MIERSSVKSYNHANRQFVFTFYTFWCWLKINQNISLVKPSLLFFAKLELSGTAPEGKAGPGCQNIFDAIYLLLVWVCFPLTLLCEGPNGDCQMVAFGSPNHMCFNNLPKYEGEV